MTSGGRIAGGIICLIGGGISLLLAWVAWILAIFALFNALCFFITLAMGILAVVSGVLMLVDKAAGGAIALIVGVIMIAGRFINQEMLGLDPQPIPLVLSIWVDAVMILVGGILGLATGSEL